MHHTLLVVHLLAATVWVGGHLVLALGYLPAALRKKDPAIIRDFESQYEKIGIPALVLLVITGLWMAADYSVSIADWFTPSTPIGRMVSIKLLLLLVTILLGVHARIFLIPKLNEHNLRNMALHIIAITITGICMLVTGSFGRYGGIG